MEEVITHIGKPCDRLFQVHVDKGSAGSSALTLDTYRCAVEVEGNLLLAGGVIPEKQAEFLHGLDCGCHFAIDVHALSDHRIDIGDDPACLGILGVCFRNALHQVVVGSPEGGSLGSHHTHHDPTNTWPKGKTHSQTSLQVLFANLSVWMALVN